MTTERDDIEDLTEALKQLRHAYEKYFMGLERLEPLKERDAFKKRLRRLTSPAPRNTAKRFRLQSLQASLITLESHWNRITRQIEEGTYRRDRWRAEKLVTDRGDSTRASAQEQKPKAAPASKDETDSAPKQAGKSAVGSPAQERFLSAVRQLHQAFEHTRVQLGGPTKPISLETMAATVRNQTRAIKARYGCKTVEFRVGVKEGKPVLKAIPRQ